MKAKQRHQQIEARIQIEGIWAKLRRDQQKQAEALAFLVGWFGTNFCDPAGAVEFAHALEASQRPFCPIVQFEALAPVATP